MKKETRIVFSALAGLFLASALWAQPAAQNSTPKNAPGEQAAAQAQSVSGKIASVEKNSFTLTVAAGAPNGAQQLQQTTPKSMNFLIDKNTTIDGKLQVGASADVTYREDSGKNVAISVRVTP